MVLVSMQEKERREKDTLAVLYPRALSINVVSTNILQIIQHYKQQLTTSIHIPQLTMTPGAPLWRRRRERKIETRLL